MNQLRRFFKYIKDYSKYVDFSLLIIYIVLCTIGLVMIYSASMVGGPRGMLSGAGAVSSTYFYKRQLFAIILSFGIVFFMTYFMHINIIKNKRVQQSSIIGVLILLIATMLFGTEVNGSKSWLNTGIMMIQPAEFLKIVTIIYLAYIYDKKKNLNQMSLDLVAPIILIGFCSGLVMLQPDMGSTLLIFMIIISILMYSGIAFYTMLKTAAVIFGVACVSLLYNLVANGSLLSPHQVARFEVLKNPFKDESGIGYHLSNSLMAIGNGGLFGRGLGNGIMKLGYLPEPHTDFIFAVISEELGLVGVIIIISLLFFIVYKGFMYAALATSMFYRLICIGVASYIGIQTFINLGGVVGLIPLTGVPLPFLSYGGSSMLSLSIAVGLLLMASKHVKQERLNR
ncbi:FtsW/RodA/SpoVE family cell cycle protein [Macrococcus brunensis]|uniref:Probable peptidoglycan glycosyltransferase FtsW n=1 Tax=Macrococcus brunensis TaxID=198483 RepID=A0A4R6BG03_9STAP|nr:FtsW/RodA/SpoVE family cell cycle protein [Macrococcus brunensis]TDL98807.1 FtsW/RodA/SpoVE family cell cycle protein [Macrococcus brunensis]